MRTNSYTPPTAKPFVHVFNFAAVNSANHATAIMLPSVFDRCSSTAATLSFPYGGACEPVGQVDTCDAIADIGRVLGVEIADTGCAIGVGSD